MATILLSSPVHEHKSLQRDYSRAKVRYRVGTLGAGTRHKHKRLRYAEVIRKGGNTRWLKYAVH